MSENQGSVNLSLLSVYGLLDARRCALCSEQGGIPSGCDALSVFANIDIITDWRYRDRNLARLELFTLNKEGMTLDDQAFTEQALV